MEPKKYITLQVERAREQLRAAAFIKPGKNALRLRGKRLEGLIADVIAVGKRPFELIDASAVDGVEPVYNDGDIVSAENAFNDSDGITWIGSSMFFLTPDGAVVSPDQFEYLKDKSLSQAKMFAETEGGGVRSAWRSIARVAREARSDKSKDILYLTVGGLTWQTGSKRDRRSIESPLFMISVREEINAKGTPKFKLASDSFKPNGVLKREFMKQNAVDLFEGCDRDVPIGEITAAIERIKETVSTYGGGARVDPDCIRLHADCRKRQSLQNRLAFEPRNGAGRRLQNM